jgi:hypothetical protein
LPGSRIKVAGAANGLSSRLAVERHLREFDRLGEDLKVIERDLARSALADDAVQRLMTIPGVDIARRANESDDGSHTTDPNPSRMASMARIERRRAVSTTERMSA